MKRIVILGSTGSIGRNVLDVVDQHPDRFSVVGLSAQSNATRLAAQCRTHPGAKFVITSEEGCRKLLADAAELAPRSVGVGAAALVELIRSTQPDLVVNALLGFVGLEPTAAALQAGVNVALANKETIVAAGELLMGQARATGADVIPIDSEHAAISQCLKSERGEDVKRVVITASGGALRAHAPEALSNVTVEEVLAHPTWEMGDKITVDSSTLMNKGLEIIEAHWLFGLPYEKIDVVMHPQSIVHSLVEFVDGSILAQMGDPDMRYPILYALSYPSRVPCKMSSRITQFPELTFSEVNRDRYPCFELALRAAHSGGTAPTILNAANEMAVAAFLKGQIAYLRIHDIVDDALQGLSAREVTELSDIFAADEETRNWIAQRYSLEYSKLNR